MKRWRPITIAMAVVLTTILSGCFAESESTASSQPTRVTTTPTPNRFVPGAAEWEACLDMYESVAVWRERIANGIDSATACGLLQQDNPDADLMEAFGDRSWIDARVSDMLAEADPIVEHYRVSFDGTGDATVTWVGSEGNMIQRSVTLPYTDDVPMQDYLAANVTQPSGPVGCRIEVVSNAHRDGYTLDEVTPVDGQTLAQCTVN